MRGTYNALMKKTGSASCGRYNDGVAYEMGAGDGNQSLDMVLLQVSSLLSLAKIQPYLNPVWTSITISRNFNPFKARNPILT